MIAFAIKAPLYPFHGWVPAAYRQAPPEVAAMLSGVVSKAGAYGMLRFALPIFPGPAADFQPALLTLSLAGLLWCSLVAFRQPDSRGIIAYSSIGQMSLISLGIFVFNDQGGTGAAFQMINHGLLSALLFLLAGWVQLRFGSDLFTRVGALGRGRPALATICITTGVATLAVPGSSMFASEFLVLLGAFREFWLVGTLASITIVLAAMYMLRWISAVLHEPPAEAATHAAPDKGGILDLRWEAVWLVPLVAAVLALSAYPYFVTHRVDASVHALTAPAALEAGK
jgi:NADH-quinone oxidoreductase subunit M